MFDGYVSFQARLRPRAIALVTPGRWTTYADLDNDVNRLARGFAGLGVTSDSGVVAVDIDNVYLKMVTVLALARLGVVSSPADDPGADLRTTDAVGPGGAGTVWLGPDRISAIFSAAPYPVTPVRCGPETVVRVMLSSGTTRTPRRVARTWRALEANTRTAALTYLAGKGGRWVSMTNLDSGLGQAMAFAAWATGATLVTGLNVEALAKQIDALQPTIVGLTPDRLQTLLRLLPEGRTVQQDLRLVLTGSRLSAPVALEARLRLSSDVCISYGSTETGSATMADAASLYSVEGAVGYAVPGAHVDVVDSEGAPAPAGEPGEVRIFSDRIADGYLGDPSASAAAFRNGAFYSGDMGRLMPDGTLVIDGRMDERITCGGVKFLPNVLDEVALACPGVLDAACFATPDEQGIDQCWLAVVAGEDFDREELTRCIAQRASGLSVRYAWTTSIPRNDSGKIERRRLREETLKALGAAS